MRFPRWAAGRWVAGVVSVALVASCSVGPKKPLFVDVTPRPSASAAQDLGGIGDPYYPTYGNSGYDVGSYVIDAKYDPKSGRMEAVTTVNATAKEQLTRFHLDFHGLNVTALTVDGAKAEFSRQEDELIILPPAPIAAAKPFVTVVTYSGVPSSFSDPALGATGFLRTSDGAIAMGEPEAATTWFPVNDHPRDKATYSINLTVPDGVSALSSGVLAGKTAKDGWTTWQWRVTSPMASYLAAFVVGKYRVVESTHDGKPMITAVADSLPQGNIDDAVARTGEICDFLAQYFGPYPFDAYGGIVINDPRVGFALETQTRPTYSAKFWTGGQNTEVIAHELAHQWFGDSLSVDLWKDIWLNEGFATYAQWLWAEHLGGPTVQQQFDRRYGNIGDRIWDVPPGDPGKDDLFGASVYIRGGMTLHTLRLKVGDDKFFEILKTWMSEHRDANGNTQQFVDLSEKISGQQLDDLFTAWLFTPERP